MSKGYVALIDEDDEDLVAGYQWHAHLSRGKVYARARVPHPLAHIEGKPRQTVVSMHRLILGLEFGDRREGDHINGDSLDNRRSNLRVVTHQQNMWNQGSKGGASTFRGVSRCRDGWRAQIRVGSKVRHLGVFDSELEAAMRYEDVARKIRGEFHQVAQIPNLS